MLNSIQPALSSNFLNINTWRLFLFLFFNFLWRFYLQWYGSIIVLHVHWCYAKFAVNIFACRDGIKHPRSTCFFNSRWFLFRCLCCWGLALWGTFNDLVIYLKSVDLLYNKFNVCYMALRQDQLVCHNNVSFFLP